AALLAERLSDGQLPNVVLSALAVSHAESGDFKTAIRYQRQLIGRASAAGKTPKAGESGGEHGFCRRLTPAAEMGSVQKYISHKSAWLEAAMVSFTTAEKTVKKSLLGPAAALLSGGDLLVRERERPVVSTGFGPLDALLPAGGVRPGSLIEWMAEGNAGPGAGGAASLACAVACRLAAVHGGEASGDASGDQTRPRTIVVIDRTGWFHPPAVLPWLDDQRRLVVARPSRDEDEIWAIDQALRCTGVAAVVAWPRALRQRSSKGQGSRLAGSLQQWSTTMRRWQLAAAASGAVGLFVRPSAAWSQPSWAEARVAVSPQSGGSLTERRLRLTLVGGNWSAITGDGQRTSDVVLDLARGCARTARCCAEMTRPTVRPGSLPSAVPMTSSTVMAAIREASAGRKGAACRAS
ncbi:MAG: ImuA family protein, partial [Pirellulales bacterium]